MLIKIKSNKSISLDKKLNILNDLYTDDSSLISNFLNKRPDEYFKYLRLEIPKDKKLVGKLYVDDSEIDPKKLLLELEKNYSEYSFELLDNPFTEYKALEEIVFKIISKINTPDIPYKLYTTRPLSKTTFDYILDYLNYMENKNKYTLEQLENPIHDPMYMYKKSYIILKNKWCFHNVSN